MGHLVITEVSKKFNNVLTLAYAYFCGLHYKYIPANKGI